MDVSRIEAISPKQIEWRQLTAQEIIKYQEQGVEVPSQYLQWAQNFINDVDAADKDETTYEQSNSVQEASTDSSQVGQEKRKQLQDDSVSLVDQAKIFTADSENSVNETQEAEKTITQTEANSNDEIQSLEAQYQEFLAEEQALKADIKSEVAAVNSGDNKSSLSKIVELREKLSKLGIDMQGEIGQSVSNFNGYNALLSDAIPTLLEANSYGSTSIEVGEELKSISSYSTLFGRPIEYYIGEQAVKSGDSAVEISEAVSKTRDEVEGVNSDNLSKARSFIPHVNSAIAPEDRVNTTNKSDPSKQQTESDKAASASLDQILKSKIRKGQNVEGEALS